MLVYAVDIMLPEPPPIRAGYYWPTIFADTLNFVKRYQTCQLFAGKKHLMAMPLKSVAIDAPF